MQSNILDYFLRLQDDFFLMLVRGGATIFRVGVQILLRLRAKRAEKFCGLYPPPTYDILEVQQLQREPIGQRFPGICLRQYYFLLVMHL